ncbi:MAG: cellulase family glycosylhydrolase [Acidimicrobiales bacterium]
MANEPRSSDCADSDGDGRPGPGQVTAWADNMSRFIRSIDRHHLISVGDAGFDCTRRTPEYPYSCAEGVDNEALSALAEVDLVSAHLYSDVEHGYWFGADSIATQISDGSPWIEHHADRADRLGKAMLLSEYGRSCAEQGTGRSCAERASAYAQWKPSSRTKADIALLAVQRVGRRRGRPRPVGRATRRSAPATHCARPSEPTPTACTEVVRVPPSGDSPDGPPLGAGRNDAVHPAPRSARSRF